MVRGTRAKGFKSSHIEWRGLVVFGLVWLGLQTYPSGINIFALKHPLADVF